MIYDLKRSVDPSVDQMLHSSLDILVNLTLDFTGNVIRSLMSGGCCCYIYNLTPTRLLTLFAYLTYEHHPIYPFHLSHLLQHFLLYNAPPKDIFYSVRNAVAVASKTYAEDCFLWMTKSFSSIPHTPGLSLLKSIEIYKHTTFHCWLMNCLTVWVCS